VKVTITFEPESLDDVIDTLVINGGVNGAYKVHLTGKAKAPVPQVREDTTTTATSTTTTIAHWNYHKD